MRAKHRSGRSPAALLGVRESTRAFSARRTVLYLSLTLGSVLAACAPSTKSGSTFGTENERSDDRSSEPGTLGRRSDEQAAPDTFESCATQTAAAEARPIYLVFVFDKSGSMVAGGSPKWTSAKAASKAFFESSESKGVHASLTFFPDQAEYSCGSNAYDTPTVAMTALPSKTFSTSLDAQIPNGGTPTHAALEGAIAYAQNVATNQEKDGKVAIVLVTDGLPESNCDGNSVAAVKELAASVAQALPTYVIGVGSELTSLTEIAAGGGTSSAFIVDTNAPAQIQQDFLAAINAIKISAFSCDYAIPSPPTGERLDREKVNVVHRSDRASDTLAYNPSCDGGTGWRYDDPTTPSRIQLCDASCRSAKAEPGKLEVLFGCATRNVVVK